MNSKALATTLAALMAVGLLFPIIRAADESELDIRNNEVDRDASVAASAQSVVPGGFDSLTGLIWKEFLPPIEYKSKTEFKQFTNPQKKPGSIDKDFIDIVMSGADLLAFPFSESKDRILVTAQINDWNDVNIFPLRSDGNLRPVVEGTGAPPQNHWAAKIGRSAIVATIPSTPCKTVRAPTTGNAPPRLFTSTEPSATWDRDKSIVLIEHSIETIELLALNAYSKPRWDVIRNPADAAALTQAPFPAKEKLTLTQHTGKMTQMALDAVGSFSVIQFDDVNEDGVWNEGTEQVCFLNIVVARVVLIQDQSQAIRERAARHIVPGAYRVNGQPAQGVALNMSHGEFQLNDDNDAGGLNLKADIGIYGGGANGRLGAVIVEAGWCNNIQSVTWKGVYRNGWVVECYATETNRSGDPDFITVPASLPAAATVPITAANPIADRARFVDGLFGGWTTLLTTRDLNFSDMSPLGVKYVVRAVDSPNIYLPCFHPKSFEQLLTAQFEVDFKAYLVVWSGAKFSDPGANLYTAVAEFSWTIRSNYTLNWPESGLPTVVADQGNDIAKEATTVHDPIVPMSGRGETYSPSGLEKFSTLNATE